MYEIEPALVASVLRALGAAFPDYVIYAATATDLLIIAGASETLNRPLNDVFAQPGLATELRRVQVGTLGDIALRRLGNKHTLAPLFDGYDVPANSDYFPFLDANAARHRFLQSSARELNQLGSDSLPVIEVLEGAPRPPHALSYEGESFLTQMETARRARYALNFVSNRNPEPRAIPTQFQKDLELLQMRAIDCRDPERYDIWLHSALQVARTVNVGLGSADANAFWAHLTQAPCAARLAPQDKRWLLLHTAAGARDPGGMREHASWLLANGREISAAQRQYLLTAALTGAIALKDFDAAVALWNAHIDQVARNGLDMNLRLLHGQMAAAGRTKSGAPVN